MIYDNRSSEPITLVSYDNNATNGALHIIDKVLCPPSNSPPIMSDPVDSALPVPTKNVVELAETHEDLSTLVNALKLANLAAALAGKGPFTVFAPTNEAFARLDTAVLKWLMEPEHTTELATILGYHVVEGAAV